MMPCTDALLTDLYQLTMAYAQWRAGRAEREAVFHLGFRRAPFGGAWAIAGGLGPALEYLLEARFGEQDLAFLGALPGNDGRPLFPPEFLAMLRDGGRIAEGVDVEAVPEGTVVFPHEPLLTVRGPIWRAHLLETPLLTLINHSTLIATKAARLCIAARGKPVLELGLRRAPGPDGGVSASRAAYLGGAAGTSNLLAAMRFGIPARGTLAHAFVMSFDDELAAFQEFARAMPNNVTLLVDTYDTLRGVDRAVKVGCALRAEGHALSGIRLDSGDLAALALEARRRLDAAGLTETRIVASNDLDEPQVAELERVGAPIDVYGVGTALVTGGAQSSLGGVYKLAAFADAQGALTPRVKLSADPAKISYPGLLQVRRGAREDVLWERGQPPHLEGEDLLRPALIGGRLAGELEPLEVARARAAEGRRRFAEVRVAADHPVTLEPGYAARREQLVRSSRAETVNR
jgi:nicotinate phosphoribosyltransferase